MDNETLSNATEIVKIHGYLKFEYQHWIFITCGIGPFHLELKLLYEFLGILVILFATHYYVRFLSKHNWKDMRVVNCQFTEHLRSLNTKINRHYLDDECNENPNHGRINLGKIQFKLEYDYYKETLLVTIIRAVDLLALNMDDTSNPFVQVYLLPNKTEIFQTEVHNKTLNPFFNDIFVFKLIPYVVALKKTLVFAVFNFKTSTKNDHIGQVRIRLSDVNLNQIIITWRNIQRREETPLNTNKIIV